MSVGISRRQFLKLSTVSAALSACSPATKRIMQSIEPQVRPPEETLPGQPVWYASTCRMCPAGCGIIVRTVNGRAKKIEGNPVHPLNRGKLCARGQAGLQELYHPDRLQNAVRQSGGRGSRQFEPLYWDDALRELRERLQSSVPARIAFLGGIMPDSLHLLFNRWLDALGAPPPVMFDLLTTLDGRTTASQVATTLYGSSLLPVYDIGNANAIFSFGANLLEVWESPVAYGRAFGQFRQGQTGGRGFFVQFEPRLSATAALADEWIPIRPGTEGLVALALGRIIVEEGLAGAFGRAQADLYRQVEVGALAEASDVSAETIMRLATTLAQSDRPVAIPGGLPAGHSNGYQAHLAIHALNHILRRLGLPGGVFLTPPSPAETLPAAPPPDSYRNILSLAAKMRDGEVDLLLIHGANPLFELPAAAGFAEALARVPFIVSFSPFVDETAAHSDLILPDHTYLESWGYEVVTPGADRPTVSGQQPVVRPLYDTRSTASVLLDLAAEMGGAMVDALPWSDETLFLEDSAGVLFGSSLSAYGARTPGEFWAKWQQFGGWWSERELYEEPDVVGFEAQRPLEIVGPTYEGDATTYPYHLHLYPTVGLGDGRTGHLPWLQELPETMSTARWQTWVELNPQTAHRLGVENNDVVKVISPYGELEAAVVVFPGIRPDVVGIPVGQGHQDYGRYAARRGKNPMTLLAPTTDHNTGALAWGATRVRLEPTGQTYTLARLESLDGEGRERIR
ncbi:MAG: molybdopterin-dependent oxidoreductase [Candidatus Promineifilaceae bacterium]|nr:molybdopterin-dependent oxidoreductase [Candidatus Promineifilaceae bacterium]